MNRSIAIGVGLIVLVMLLLFSTTFTVKYNQVAVKATFGQTDENSVITEAGLHYRLPVIHKVETIDTRLQLIETPLEEIATSDGLQIVGRAYLLWRVDMKDQGPLDFFKSYGKVADASESLRYRFRSVVEAALSKQSFSDLIGKNSQLSAVETDIRNQLASTLTAEGIEPVMVGINRIMLPPKTSSAVLSRMQATRNVIAEGERRTGQAEAERIRAEGNTWADKIRAFAIQRAEEIRAVGEREAAKYYEQQGTDEDFAIFLVKLNMLEQTLSSKTTFVIPTTTGLRPFSMLAPSVALGEGDELPTPAPVTEDPDDESRAEIDLETEKAP